MICVRCGKDFERDSMEEHHIIPRSVLERKWSDRLRELMCKECHKKTTQEFMESNLVWLPNNNYLKVIV